MRRFSVLIFFVLAATLLLFLQGSQKGSFKSEFELRQRGGEAADDYIASQVEACYRSTSRGSCYRDLARLFLSQFSMREILDVFRENERKPEFYADCHEISHYLGRQEYRNRGSMSKAFSQCTQSCLNGCYHGVVEGYFQEKSLLIGGLNDETLKQEISGICGTKDSSEPYVYNECNHGIGHALMLITNMDLPRSLALCDTLPGLSGDEPEKCYDGVFMENFASATNPAHTTQFIREEDPLYPCNTLEEKYAWACYSFQALYFLERAKGNWQEAMRLCSQVPENYQRICFSQLGENIAGFSQDRGEWRDMCALSVSSEQRGYCVEGVVRALGGRFIGDASYMLQFCAEVEVEDKEICYSQIGESINNWGYDFERRKIVCAGVKDQEFIQECTRPIAGFQTESN